MGCWNGTCMVSNLPIMAGEPVVGFIIVYSSFEDEKNFSGTCYPEDRARPISLPIYGVYDDYGSIEEIDPNTLSSKHLLNMFGESDIHDLIRDIERDNRTIQCNRVGKIGGVGMVMIAGSIYDKLVRAYKPGKYARKYVPDEHKIISGLKATREHIERKAEWQKQLKEGGPDALDRDTLSLLIGIRPLSSQLGLHVDILEESDMSDMIEFVIGLTDKHDESIARELAVGLKERWVLRAQMGSLRKLWLGPSGKGSQSRDYKTHLILADAIKEHIFSSFDGPEDMYLTLLGERDW